MQMQNNLATSVTQSEDAKLSTTQLAKMLKTSNKVITENTKKCLPNKIIENGKLTFYNEAEVTVLIDYMKKNNNRVDTPTFTTSSIASTSLSPALEMAQLIQRIKSDYERIIAITNTENNRLQKQNDTLQIKLDQHNDWISVRRYNIEFNGNGWNLSRCQKIGKDLSRYCRENDIEVKKSLDPLFGEVNAYPLSVFDKYFGGVI
jgi:hypothetical protein